MKKILLTFLFLSFTIMLMPKKALAVCGTTELVSSPRGRSTSYRCSYGEDTIIEPFDICSVDKSICCSGSGECPINTISPTNDFFDQLNPLVQHGTEEITADLSTPGGIVSRLLQFLFPIAGLILFVMLVWGGFEILSKSTQGTKGMEAGKNRITAAIVGFLLLFATYWMAQIIEVVFGIVIV